jgi:hypothetical protein
MPQPYNSIEIRPPNGGALITNLSTDTAGILNYQNKLNFRRYIDRELRREGHDYFQGNTDIELGSQPFPYGPGTDLALGGNWGAEPDVITVKKGWSYIYIGGDSEFQATNGEDGPIVADNELFQALTGEVFVISAEAEGDPRDYQLIEFAPITLIHEARRPNGQKAIIVGTPTTLYRYFSLENGDVFEAGVFEVFPTDPDGPTFSGDLGDWIIIADGFNPDAQRWEAVSINGWSIFNNGLDPEYSYRVEHLTARNMYELRESGVACVGCIAEFFGILMLADICEIQEEKLIELFDPIGVRRSGAMLANVPDPGMGAWTVYTTQDFFTADDSGRVIVFDNGVKMGLLTYVGPREMIVDGMTVVTPQRFMLRTPASQVGSFFSGSITGTQLNASPDVLASAPVFAITDIGKTLRYINGWSSEIVAFVDDQNVTLDDPAPEDFTALPFFLVSAPDDFTVIATASIFTADMVGLTISWEDGTVRRITAFVDDQTVVVDSDMAIASQIIGIENLATYAAYTEREFINRIQYRLMWSMNELPTRFAPTFKGAMQLNGFRLTLDQPAKSIVIGDRLIVEGAGAAGGNLIADVLYVAANQVISLSEFAQTPVLHANVIKADAASSIVGFDDIQDDSSAISHMLELDGTLVIYKDTALAFARYTARVDNPFAITLRRISQDKSLFYRNTPVLVNNAQHIYAGRNSFFRLTTVDLFPREVPELEVCKDKFFSKAKIENTKWIFSANNILTKEVFFVNFPYTGTDRALCYDYLTPAAPTVSTSDLTISAAGFVKRPLAGTVIGETPDWFLMGTPRGVVLLYGLVTSLETGIFAGALSIWYRRELNPYSATKISYPSRLKSGLSNFGSIGREKDIKSWVPILSSLSPQTSMTLRLHATRNPVEPTVQLMTGVVSATENLAPMFFRSHYFADELAVETGLDNPLELVARAIEISGVNSGSFARRVT